MATVKRGILNYIKPILAPTCSKEPLKVGGLGKVEAANDFLVAIEKKILNARSARFNLRDDGFELLSGISLPFSENRSSLLDPRTRYFATREVFIPLAMQLAQDRLGLKPYSAFCLFPYYRKAPVPSGNDNSVVDTREHKSGSAPHAMVHSDFGYKSLESIQNDSNYFNIRDPQKAAKADKKFARATRMVVLQFWMSAQPQGTVIENDTLALCHPRSIQLSDLVSRQNEEYSGHKVNFSILQAKDSKLHEWFYWPHLKTDECLVWVGYDSAWGDNMTPCFHTSFHDSTVSSDARPRESIECRTMLLLDEQVPSRL